MSAIRSVESFVVPYVEPNDHDSTRYVCLVRIEDSDGVIGWGEAATLFRPATHATASLVSGWSDELVGLPADVACVATRIVDDGWWYTDTGIACFARAGIDLALWDIEGKRAGISLAERLGAPADGVPVLLSCHAALADLGLMATQLAESVAAVDATGIKVGFGKRGDAHLGYDHDRDVEFVGLLRGALGPASRIMIDIGAKIRWSTDEAIRRIRAFEQFDISWTEEPLGADDPEGYRTLKDTVNSPIAYGEREWNPRGYERIIGTGTVDVVGIDPGRACGITGFRQVVAQLETAEVQGNAHAFTGPLILASSIALSAASPAFRQIEVTPRRNALFDLVDAAPVPRDGVLVPSTLPGLGVEILEDRVRAVAERAA